MFRSGPRLVTIGAVLWLAAGCAPDLPRDIYIDDAFTAEEEAMIVEMIGEWNRVGREYLGKEEILIYRGRFFDTDGFDPDDLGDDFSVIYRGTEDGHYRYLDEDNGLTLLGYGTLADVLLFTFSYSDEREFRHVALHELGHFLGLGHVPDDVNAVMYYLTLDDPPPPLVLTRIDIQAFCLVYDCIKQP